MSEINKSGNIGLVIVPFGLSAVFLLDIVGPFEPVVSVLYVPVLVLAARLFARSGVVYVGVVCIVLTATSYVLANVEGFDSVTARQFGAILCTVIVTTVLLVTLPLPHPEKLI